MSAADALHDIADAANAAETCFARQGAAAVLVCWRKDLMNILRPNDTANERGLGCTDVQNKHCIVLSSTNQHQCNRSSEHWAAEIGITTCEVFSWLRHLLMIGLIDHGQGRPEIDY